VQLKFNVKRYQHVLTDEVYNELTIYRPDTFFAEETPTQTSSPYPASTASADLLVQTYYRAFILTITITRCSNNYGPYHFPEKLIPLMIKKILINEVLTLYRNAENVRDWLNVIGILLQFI
jgi:dTDP-glucose 4,6-dehydratase